MSLLFTDQTDEWALLVADTVVTLEDKPYMFGSKVTALPHLNMTVSTLGSHLVGMSWRNVIDTTPGLVDIETVNEVAPGQLRRLWDEYNAAYEQFPMTSTVYHHGFPAGSNKIVSYAYRSTNDFEPERFEGSQFTVKPVLPDFQYQRPQSQQEVIDLAIRVRDMNHEQLGHGWGVRIGGDLIATMVQNGHIETALWHRFDDYDESVAAMPRPMG
ncbi:hypothetical protein [Microbacterium immunditiarum]|uniref:Uncharacterized protein n=1 Tax=Microbacterium immunditiarum TaxID=337480 RepID=A0A7Y9GMY8_9MICO|nr:hypothetical protein [Microbacterium immunditiarum]NYE19457.1 hypothetical protein [Microbacterium immunditiarum]